MLILAGVSINAVVGDNGILTKAQQAKMDMEIATEKEMIELLKLELLSEQNLESGKTVIGKKLYDKTIENGNIWNIIVKKETHEVYGTGYSFIEAGTNMENYGTLKSNWLINNTTNEVIELNSDEFVELSYDTSLGVKEGLLLNIDSTMIENGNEEKIKEQLGSKVELVNFNWEDENSGIDSNSFNLDGVNDYIKIKYEEEEEKQMLAQNGFTFEFYGKLTPGVAWDVSGNEWVERNDSYKRAGIFMYGYSEEGHGDIRINEWVPGSTFLWNASSGKFMSDFSQNTTYPWNICYNASVCTGEDVYFTLSLDTSESKLVDGIEYYTDSLYINGEKLYSGKYNKNSWDYFINNSLDDLDTFFIGYCNMTQKYYWYFSKMNVYTMRLYNRGLSEKEIMENYEKTLAYKNVETSNIEDIP